MEQLAQLIAQKPKFLLRIAETTLDLKKLKPVGRDSNISLGSKILFSLSAPPPFTEIIFFTYCVIFIHNVKIFFLYNLYNNLCY